MLTVKDLMDALEGIDPDAQVVVGIINGPRFNAAYAEPQVCLIAQVDSDQNVTLGSTTSPALYLCCYEQQRPWEGQQPGIGPDGNPFLGYDPEGDPTTEGEPPTFEE